MRLLTYVIAATATVAFSAVPWYSSYEEGLAAFENGDHSSARAHFEAALAARPVEDLSVTTEGARSVDYLPNLYLAIACYHMGDVETARHYLDAARDSGVAAGSPVGGPLLDHYGLLTSVERPPPDAGDRVASAVSVVTEEELGALQDFDRRPEVLTDEELARTTRETLTRCGMAPETGVSRAPWYFHYEMGLRLAEKGDLQRAVDFLIAAAQRKPMPNQTARMYGMWFTDYRPYLEIADSHAGLGNWRCAFNALELSEKTGEVDRRDDDEVMVRFRGLMEECEAHLESESGAQRE